VTTPQINEWLQGTAFWDWAEKQSLPVAPVGATPWMVWTDMETTGLDPVTEVPLEFGIILTDRFGNLIPDGAHRWLVFDDMSWAWKRRLDTMDPFVEQMHAKSGLLDDLAEVMKNPFLNSPPRTVENQAMHWLGQMFGRTFEGKERIPSSGSSVHFDRKFLEQWMPDLDKWFLHRNGDVSSLRYFTYLHQPDLESFEPEKREIHRVFPDIVDSIKLYRFLINNLFYTDPVVEANTTEQKGEGN